MTSFVIVNNCSDAELTPELLARIAAALEVWLNRDVCTHYGGDARVRAATADNPPADGEVVALVVDTLPDEPDAVAFHNWQGHAQIYAARNMCGSLIGGQGSLAVTLSAALAHEFGETMVDEPCDEWVDDGTGHEVAKEICDPVESSWYMVNGIPVSDFVLPSWFAAGALGPYSFVQLQHEGDGPNSPFELASGGYKVQRTATTDEREVMAMAAPEVTVSLSVPFGLRQPKKAHWSSRTFRRGARVKVSPTVAAEVGLSEWPDG